MKAFFSRIVAGVGALASKTRVEEDLDQELREYLNASVEQKVAAGMSGTEAVRAARADCPTMLTAS